MNVSSRDVEGKGCHYAEYGDNRDRQKGKKQIVYGLLWVANGCPIAIKVFKGHTADPATVACQVNKTRKRFGLIHVALVDDRGMITFVRIREDLEPANIDWISALKTPDMRTLLTSKAVDHPAPLQPKTVVPDAVAEIIRETFHLKG